MDKENESVPRWIIITISLTVIIILMVQTIQLNSEKEMLEEKMGELDRQVIGLEEENREVMMSVKKKEKEVADKKQEIKEKISLIEDKDKEIKSLKQKNREINNKINSLKKTSVQVKSNNVTVKKNNGNSTNSKKGTVHNMEATHYTAFCDTGCTGVTATGVDVSNTIYHKGKRVVAVDPNVIPLGSTLKVTGGGHSFEAVAADTGGKIRGNKIDILVDSTQEAYQLGRKSVQVEVIN